MHLLPDESTGVKLVVLHDIVTNRKTEIYAENLAAALIQACPAVMTTMRLYADYNDNPSAVSTIPIATMDDLVALRNFTSGTFGLVMYPADPLVVAFVVALTVSVGAAILLRPKLPQPDADKDPSDDTRNSLSSRSNKPRPFERVQDLYGKCWSTPDAISSPLRVFEGGVEVEYSYLALTRGEVEIHAIEEGITPVESIPQMSVAVLGTGRHFGTPFVRPQWHRGNDIASYKPKEVYLLSAVDSIELPAPTERTFDNVGISLSNTGRVTFPATQALYVDNPAYNPPYGVGDPHPPEKIWLTFPVIVSDLFAVGDVVTLDAANVPVVSSLQATLKFFADGYIEVVTPSGLTITSDDYVNIRGHRAVIKGRTISLDGVYRVLTLVGDNFIIDTSTANGSPSSDWPIFNANVDSSPTTVELVVRNNESTYDLTSGSFYTDGSIAVSPELYDAVVVGDYITIVGHLLGSYDGRAISLDGVYQISAKSAGSLVFDLTQTADEFNAGAPSPEWLALLAESPAHTVFINAGTLGIISAPNNTATMPLDGDYTVIGIGARYIDLALDDRAAEWQGIGTAPVRVQNKVKIMTELLKWRGVYVGKENVGGATLVMNFVADKGLYIVTTNNDQYSLKVEGIAQVITYDANDMFIAVEDVAFSMQGSAINKKPVGTTAYYTMPSNAVRFTLRVVRMTDPASTMTTQFGGAGEEVKLREVMWVQDITDDGGEVTTLLTRATATPTTAAIQERRLNVLATRIVERAPDDFVATDNPVDIFYAMTLDPRIGRLAPDDIDIVQIRAELAEAEAYFGVPLRFGYAFGDANSSYEEMGQVVAGACFCKAYRQGSLIRWRFERERLLPRMIFNHRNAKPDSFTLQRGFGVVDDKDSVEITYYDADEKDKATVITLPPSGGNTPSKQTLSGVRDRRIAEIHAWRLYNKLRMQRNTYEITATEEAQMLLPDDHIAMSDFIGAETFAGEVRAVNGLVLTVSENVPTVNAGNDIYYIYVQHYDGYVESIPVYTASGRTITLAQAPRLPLVTNPLQGILTTFIMANDGAKTLYHCTVQTTELQKATDTEQSLWAINATDYNGNVYDHDFMHKGA